MERGGAVYIMSNKYHTVFYTGVTSSLYSRVIEHREKYYPTSFTAKYNSNKLLYFESFHSIEEAKIREYQIKNIEEKRKSN